MNEQQNISRASDLLNVCELSLDDVNRAGTTVEELHAIYSHHAGQFSSLESTARAVLDLLRDLREVHSVRFRVKSPIRLVRKIVRKRLDDPQRIITLENYQRAVTDLVGIRTLHLFKEDWEAIDAFITSQWDTIETPIAYVRAGDRTDWIEQFKLRGCRVDVHPRSYRSVHYLIPSSTTRKTTTIEIQVRTLMEEVWSEIDHRINYPEKTPHGIIRQHLLMLNRIAGTADEMGSFVNDLERQLDRAKRVEQVATESISRILPTLNLSPDQQQAFEMAYSTALGRWISGEEHVSPSEIKPIADAVAAATYLSKPAIPTFFSELMGKITVPRTCTICEKQFEAAGTSAYGDHAVCPKCEVEKVLEAPGKA